MNSPNKLTVRLNGRNVGELQLSDEGMCVFRYSRGWLADGFSISPLELPLKDGLFTAKPNPFRGNFGIFEDSLPDGYGSYLIDRMLRNQGIDSRSLNPLQWLSIVGKNGMGALSYEPESNFNIYSRNNNPVELDELQRIALEVLSEKNSEDIGMLYYNSGNSGGCRPKATFHDEEGSWLVKFRHVYDSPSIGKIEYAYSECARECGLDVADFRLMHDRYFASRRFDIDENGRRIHTATAGALLGETIHPPKTDYKILLSLTGFVTQNPEDVIEMFRRMVFNVFSENKDDHAKNFTFLCAEGNWRLAPAYDMTYCPQGYNGEHASSVNYNGNPTVQDMLDLAAAMRIPDAQAKEVIDHIRPKCESLIKRTLSLYKITAR